MAQILLYSRRVIRMVPHTSAFDYIPSSHKGALPAASHQTYTGTECTCKITLMLEVSYLTGKTQPTGVASLHTNTGMYLQCCTDHFIHRQHSAHWACELSRLQ